MKQDSTEIAILATEIVDSGSESIETADRCKNHCHHYRQPAERASQITALKAAAVTVHGTMPDFAKRIVTAVTDAASEQMCLEHWLG